MSQVKEATNLAQVLPEIFQSSHIMNSTGSLHIQNKQKQSAQIFLEHGNIISVDHIEYEANLWHQLRFEGIFNHVNAKALIRSNKTQRDSLYRILKKTRSKHPNSLQNIQDYILGALDDLYTWENITVEWKVNEKFKYTSANIDPFPLTNIASVLASREIYKYEKFYEWGFKNEAQFLQGEVRLSLDENERSNIPTQVELEACILRTPGHFLIQGIHNTSGYALVTIMTTLENLKALCPWTIENPYGRHQPEKVPAIPSEIPVITNTAHFSNLDEDESLENSFNTEYHVPEAAFLEDTLPPSPLSETFDRFMETANAEEINETQLKTLQENMPQTDSSDAVITDTVLEKEEETLQDLSSMYTDTTTGSIPFPVTAVKPAEEPAEMSVEDEILAEMVEEYEQSQKLASFENKNTETELSEEEDEDMANLDLGALVARLAEALNEQKQTIQEKEKQLTQKSALLSQTEDKLAQEEQAVETARQLLADAEQKVQEQTALRDSLMSEKQTIEEELVEAQGKYQEAVSTIESVNIK